MYLSREEIGGSPRYLIKETFKEGEQLKSHILFDLGPDPSEFIIYPGGNSFYIDAEVELSITGNGIEVDTFELEDLFFPFLDTRLKRTIRPSTGSDYKDRYRGLSKSSLMELQSGIHIFDRRRLHFIRFGSIRQDNIDAVPYRFFNRLLEKSRDEIECLIVEAESSLGRSELKHYVYTIFNLQRFFPDNYFAGTVPWMLDQELIDSHFIEELCSLNRDTTYTGDDHCHKTLHPRLSRYVIMYFDNEFVREPHTGRFNGSRSSDRGFKPSPAAGAKGFSIPGTCRILNLSVVEYNNLDRKGLTRRFRRLAHEHHPDKGGNHDRFIDLCRAYERLLKGKTE